MQTIQQPDKITVPTHNLAVTTRAGDLVVAMLEHEDALFLRERRDGYHLFGSRPSDAAASERPS
jgi:hypothetical protein